MLPFEEIPTFAHLKPHPKPPTPPTVLKVRCFHQLSAAVSSSPGGPRGRAALHRAGRQSHGPDQAPGGDAGPLGTRTAWPKTRLGPARYRSGGRGGHGLPRGSFWKQKAVAVGGAAPEVKMEQSRSSKNRMALNSLEDLLGAQIGRSSIRTSFTGRPRDPHTFGRCVSLILYDQGRSQQFKVCEVLIYPYTPWDWHIFRSIGVLEKGSYVNTPVPLVVFGLYIVCVIGKMLVMYLAEQLYAGTCWTCHSLRLREPVHLSPPNPNPCQDAST